MVGVDETLERRRGKKIAPKGIYRDPVRSSHSHFVKPSALRWVCVTLLAEIPWASRVWALLFLSALAPSERYLSEHGKRHKSISEWALQLLLLIRRWHPGREIVTVADGAYASLKLLDRCRRSREPITFIMRLRLDAALYKPAPPRYPGLMVDPGSRVSACPTYPLSPKIRTPSGPHHASRLVRRRGTRCGDHLQDGRVVLHGVARRTLAMGVDPRPRKTL